MSKLIGYARVSTKAQDTDRQEADLLGAGVRKDDLYVDHGLSGGKASRPHLGAALDALQEGDTLVITTLDRLGRGTQNMLVLAEDLKARGVNLRVLNLGGGDIDTSSPMGALMFTVMSGLAQMELDIKRERINDSVTKRRNNGGNLGGAKDKFTDTEMRRAIARIDDGEAAAAVARSMGMSRATLYRRVDKLKAA